MILNLKKLATLIFITSILSCSSDKKLPVNDNAVALRIDGSSTVFPITQGIVNLYKNEYNNFKISLAVSGTGGGFEKFVRNEISINNASRPIKDNQKALCEKNGVKYLQIEVAYDGIAVVINSQNNWADYLTVDDLQLIWKSDGAINWSDVRQDWPNEPISLYGPGDASGTLDYFKISILSSQQKFRSDYRKSENDNLLANGIANDKYSIGFFGLAYYEKNKDKLGLLAIDNGNGAILPTKESISKAQYTPLSRPMFIYVNKEFADTKGGSAFLRFYLENAGHVSNKIGYVELSKAKYENAIAQLKL